MDTSKILKIVEPLHACSTPEPAGMPALTSESVSVPETGEAEVAEVATVQLQSVESKSDADPAEIATFATSTSTQPVEEGFADW